MSQHAGVWKLYDVYFLSLQAFTSRNTAGLNIIDVSRDTAGLNIIDVMEKDGR